MKVRNSREVLGIILKHKKAFERGIKRTLFTTCALIISETTHVYRCVMIICIPVELIKRTISETLKGNDICSARDMRALSRGCVRFGHVKKKVEGELT